MTYRNDEDALWHRAHSLQRELDSTQAELTNTREQRDLLAADRRRLATQLGHLPPSPQRKRAVWIVLALFVAVVAIPALVITNSASETEGSHATSPESAQPSRCVIDSIPSGAEVVCVVNTDPGSAYREVSTDLHEDFEMVRGHTPFSKSRDYHFGRGLCDEMVLRMTGYVEVPIGPSNCGATIQLTPSN